MNASNAPGGLRLSNCFYQRRKFVAEIGDEAAIANSKEHDFRSLEFHCDNLREHLPAFRKELRNSRAKTAARSRWKK